jgi:hypothetical protein
MMILPFRNFDQVLQTTNEIQPEPALAVVTDPTHAYKARQFPRFGARTSSIKFFVEGTEILTVRNLKFSLQYRLKDSFTVMFLNPISPFLKNLTPYFF